MNMNATKPCLCGRVVTINPATGTFYAKCLQCRTKQNARFQALKASGLKGLKRYA